MTEERDSQLSAMFDDELPGGECELLARRMSRDEALRGQWSRYAMIGAALRAERGVALHDRVALKVQSVVVKEVTYGEGNVADVARPAAASTQVAARRWVRFGYPLAGASIAAGVAAVSIFWLQGVQPQGDASLQASTTAPTTIVLTPDTAEIPGGATVALNAPEPVISNGEPERYTTPVPSSVSSLAPPARLANYVVAHSEFSGPLQRRMALLGIVGSEGDTAAMPDAAPADEGVQGDNGQ